MGRPAVPDGVRERMRALVEEDPVAPPLEVLRLLREEAVQLGESTFYRLYRVEREALPLARALLVSFEGSCSAST